MFKIYRKVIFKKILSQEMAFFDSSSLGELNNIMTK